MIYIGDNGDKNYYYETLDDIVINIGIEDIKYECDNAVKDKKLPEI